MSTEPNDPPLSLDSLYANLNAEYQSAPALLPTASDATAAPTPTGEGDAATSGATAGTETHAPPKGEAAQAEEVAPAPPAPPKKVEGKGGEESDPEARIKKLENDLALAKKGQAAADRRANALEQARQLEAQRIQQLKVEGRLTQEEVDRAPALMQAWVQRAETEAESAEATAETQRLIEATEQARAEREATVAVKEEALSLAKAMVSLGLTPEDADYEQLLTATLESEKYAPDVALTWKLAHDPAEAARVYGRLMTDAKADVTAELAKIAAAKAETAAKKGTVNEFDRSSSPGPSTGGPDPIPAMPLEEMWGRIVWKT